MVYFLIFIVFIFLGIINKKSKFILLCIYAILFVVSISFTSGHDINLFKDGYDMPFVDTENEEMYRSALFANFVILTKLLGLDFYEFRIVCVILWSIPILFLVFRYSKCPTFVIAVCAYFPLLTYGSLIRNGLMAGVVYWAFCILLQKHGIKTVFMYFIIIGFAGLIHNTAFFYLLALLAIGHKIETGLLLRWCILISLVVGLAFHVGVLSNLASKVVGEYYSNLYFSSKGDFLIGHVHYIVFIIVNLWAVTLADRETSKYVKKDSKLYVFSRFVKRFNILMLVFVPLLFISVTFYRIFLNLLVLNAISVSNALAIVPSGKTRRLQMMKNIYIVAYIMEVYMYNLGMGEFTLFWDSVSL